MTDDVLQNYNADDLLHWAWTIICNVGSHDGRGWDGQHSEWHLATMKLRDAYHNYLRDNNVDEEDEIEILDS